MSTLIDAATSGEVHSRSTKQRNTVSLAGSDTPLTPKRHVETFKGVVPLCKHPMSSESNPLTPRSSSVGSKIRQRASSQSTIGVPIQTNARNPPRVRVEDTDDPRIPGNRPRSPSSPGSDISDDEDTLFDTPQPKTHNPPDLSTPLTPPSVYKARNSFLGNESPSPADRKTRRPVPRRFPHFETEPEAQSRADSVLHQDGQEAGTSGDKSTKAGLFDVASRKVKITAEKEGEVEREKQEEEDDEEEEEEKEEEQGEHEDASAENKLCDIKIEEDNVKHETRLIKPRVLTTLKKETLSINCIDVLRDIFDGKIIEDIKDERERCYGFRKLPPLKDGLPRYGPRCKQPIGKEKRKLARSWLETACDPVSLLDAATKLNDIVKSIFCQDHIKTAKEKVASWIHSLDLSSPDPENHDISPLLKLEAQRRDPEEAKKKVIKRVATDDYKLSEASSTKIDCVNGISRHIPWQPQDTKHLSVKQSLAKCVIKPLGMNGGKSGHLYVYSTSGGIEPRKIGVTGNGNIETRLKYWRRCGPVVLLYPKEEKNAKQQEPSDQVYVLERLVHTELKNFRLKTIECPCKKTHKEWFTAPDDLIMAVIKKWETWLKLEPYEKYGDIWVLKDGFFNLEDVCTPCVIPIVAASSIEQIKHGKKTATTTTSSSTRRLEARAERGQPGAAR
ncbi:hypothetical protein MMC26_005510 [Xylographa opegraphella]|nr:hypothetical protein [Xylographa opegraphella]